MREQTRHEPSWFFSFLLNQTAHCTPVTPWDQQNLIFRDNLKASDVTQTTITHAELHKAFRGPMILGWGRCVCVCLEWSSQKVHEKKKKRVWVKSWRRRVHGLQSELQVSNGHKNTQLMFFIIVVLRSLLENKFSAPWLHLLHYVFQHLTFWLDIVLFHLIISRVCMLRVPSTHQELIRDWDGSDVLQSRFGHS